MPEGPDGKTIIIVKKVSGHGGHHGGAWKVAYADFVTAMMALFMVLWLTNTASVTTRERIASYFREPGVFEKGSGTPLETGGAGLLRDSFTPPAEQNSTTSTGRRIYDVKSVGGSVPDAYDTGTGIAEKEEPKQQLMISGKEKGDKKGGNGDKEGVAEEINALEKLAAEVQEQLNEGLKSGGKEGVDGKMLGKVDVKVDQRGLHIEIMDTNETSMFQSGSSFIQSQAELQLTHIAETLKKLKNPIDIEGHTDATPYSDTMRSKYDNWNLSADRANAARRIIEKVGIEQKQIARVVGYAAQRLKVPENPLHASNRRISISMRYTEMAAKALEGTNTVQTAPRVIGAKVEQVASPTPVPKPVEPEKPRENLPPPVSLGVAKQSERAQRKELVVEVGTTQPEGEPLPAEEEVTPKRGGDTWLEKDKIFGNSNPFFSD